MEVAGSSGLGVLLEVAKDKGRLMRSHTERVALVMHAHCPILSLLKRVSTVATVLY
jgi:hypothetical protein